ncbi:MAG TPA: NAD(P)/FAD-dependent oxidoreductase [Vicinamibacterales bacterium]|jgi:flavin-dependent dehydrogenase|nr:NAD(P)/FAD-dependent oxidoreductase [Vicinamibacterales bacterium]
MNAPSDVVVAGAGPAGALAACLLARAGARVTLVDRSRFPRPKLCGDTLNPGAVALLRQHVDLSPLEARATPIAGMLLSGPGPVFVRGAYDADAPGLGVTREVLDAWLVEAAVRAGATLVEGATVTGPEIGADGTVAGVRVRGRDGSTARYPATFTLGADGRRSRLGEACGLSRCAPRPRRWAIGAYFEGVAGLSALGEMHVRDGHYLGVAPTADGRANACLVQPRTRGTAAWPAPDALLAARLRADPVLGPRFRRAVATARASVLGPLAIDTRVPGCAGLFLLGDAAGFIDPMTGDGIRLALASAELAVATVSDVLNGRIAAPVAHLRYARALRARIGRKRAFNRAIRGLVSSPRNVALAARVAIFWPGAFGAAIRYAGDAPRSVR